jgi:hypothetical protein
MFDCNLYNQIKLSFYGYYAGERDILLENSSSKLIHVSRLLKLKIKIFKLKYRNKPNYVLTSIDVSYN